MPQANQKASKSPRLKWLENFKLYISTKKGTIRNDLEKQEKKPQISKRTSSLKNFELNISVGGEW